MEEIMSQRNYLPQIIVAGCILLLAFFLLMGKSTNATGDPAQQSYSRGLQTGQAKVKCFANHRAIHCVARQAE